MKTCCSKADRPLRSEGRWAQFSLRNRHQPPASVDTNEALTGINADEGANKTGPLLGCLSLFRSRGLLPGREDHLQPLTAAAEHSVSKGNALKDAVGPRETPKQTDCDRFPLVSMFCLTVDEMELT